MEDYVICTLSVDTNSLTIWRSNKVIGHVTMESDGVRIKLLENQPQLFLTDFDIIEENWNELQAIRKDLNNR